MGFGKILCILGGLITIVATYVLAFYAFPPAYGWGIAAWMFVPAIFSSGDIMIILIEILVILFLLAGLFQLIGAKSRVLGIIGSLLALAGFIYFMLIEFSLISSTAIYALLFVGEALGPLPFHISVGSFASLGAYVLAGGAVLGLIGSFAGRD